MTTEEEMQAQLDDLEKKIEEVERRNGELYREIASQVPNLDMNWILMARLETLIDSIFDEVNRRKFELRFQTRVTTELENMISEINRAKLLAPEPPMPNMGGLIQP